MPPAVPVATYRLQLRCGVDLDRARTLLPWLVELGVSHLYLSPPFHAASGSTHGYDVIDPTRIDPVLGGEEAFAALSDAAQRVGIGIVIDIVPNHMAFTPENRFLADVMRHGTDSRFAGVFDIDWDKGPIHFPVLDGTVAEVHAAGQIALAGSGDDPSLRVYDREYPLRLTPLAQRLAQAGTALDDAALDALLAEQHWSLGDWRASADRIVHRRFFNITDLIGVRQEDAEVFALTHSWIIDAVAAGQVQGLRVDHIDGLARPGGYLHRLREAVGDTPVWIEKIVKPGEQIPANWPIEGMSGYEFMSPVTRLLTDPAGLAAMREAADGAVPPSTTQEVRKVRGELLEQVFTPELERVTDAAMAALSAHEDAQPAVMDAVARLATAWPVYRSYAADLCPLSPQINEAVAATGPQKDAARLVDLLRAPDDPLARAFAARFEQLTGALTAKSEEDTVFFRSIAFLPFCEVGSEPDLDPIDREGFQELMAMRAAETPLALDALSTHDTKRSADARAVLIALSHFPQAAQDLYAEARETALSLGLPEGWGIYALQTALILRGQPDADERLADHIAKAMREAKELSRHEAPDEAAEAAVTALARTLLNDLSGAGLMPQDLAASLDAAVETVVLAQVALQLTAPGVPDIYQGTEGLAVALTDPDNRRPVDWEGLMALDAADTSLSARKLALTRELLARRRASPRLFAQGSYRLVAADNALLVERGWDGEKFTFAIPIPVRQAARLADHPA
ncbi:malto-oligosyltrehalose synthase [Novosphingobium sp. P6W]|uniref:malto-oligosyltrehalose synthase n=1 Tax=Novosphingobium sp. P6W TaxID=1609758 RepID=UPI0005C2C5A7|nr:malto-oligosyltrehalose synthase [Novosphingobium sp. P6W]AXB78461.1 malto-oligosyltrehalose synthase [Novosphingobium sp. P6W]KIS32395.1 malto-oligosyltrehalose synthase [Novosphingobium sp. P6W]